MPKQAYIVKKFHDKNLILIKEARKIIDEFQSQGFKLTLRQLYYQFVSRDIIKNNQKEYNKMGTLISDARLAGLIDWEAIEDRTRNLQINSHWKNPGEIISAASSGFMLDHWKNQKYRVEVWIEKEALVGIISEICRKLDVPYFACKGYVSSSEMWSSAQRFNQYMEAGQSIIILHLGDHDPSGIDMTRDIQDRQSMFSEHITSIEVIRIALNMDQIHEYKPPPNPAKLSDVRADNYINEYGFSSWELDSLKPNIIKDLIERNVKKYRDNSLYKKTIKQEKEYKKILSHIEANWKNL